MAWSILRAHKRRGPPRVYDFPRTGDSLPVHTTSPFHSMSADVTMSAVCIGSDVLAGTVRHLDYPSPHT